MESTRHDANNRSASTSSKRLPTIAGDTQSMIGTGELRGTETTNIKEQIARRLHGARYASPTAGLAMGVLCPAALGAPGDLDPAFADVGRFIFPSDTHGAVWSIEAQADDILVEGGDETYVEYYGFVTDGFANLVSSTGILDPGFEAPDVDGIAILDTARQGDEKIVGIGRRPNESLVFRIGPDGALDTGFGTDGILVLSGVDSARSVAVDPGGTIVVAGSQGADLKVLRLLANGEPDETFGTAGVFTAPAGSASEQLITAPRILSAEGGGYRITDNDFDSTSLLSRCRVLALTTSGAVDEGFGDAGYAGLAMSTDESITCGTLAESPDGQILVGGAEGAHPFAIRLIASGDPDLSFAIDALPATEMVDVRALALDTNTGDVLVAGQAASDVPGAIVARLHADGSLDELFGNGGTAWVDMAGSGVSPMVNDLVVQSSGDVLVGGEHSDRPFVARLVGGDGRDGPGVLGIKRFGFAATEGGEAVVTVRRIGGKSGAVSVAYQAVPGNGGGLFDAAEGEDFSATSGRLDWADGDVSDKEIVVPVAANAGSPEEQEFFSVELSDPHGGAGLGSNVAWGEIAADGSPGGLFAVFSGYAWEGDRLQVAVYRNYYTTGAVSVTVTPRSGTASAGDDFTADAVTLSWNDGEGDAKFVEIQINDDSSPEVEEQFTLELSAATGGALIGPFSTAPYSILDDDTPDTVDNGGGGGGGRVGFLSLLLLGIARALRLRRHGAPLRTTT